MTHAAETPAFDKKYAGLLTGSIALSPFGKLLGLAVETIGEDRVVLTLPYDEKLTTIADIVHGGAIASLADAAATAAAWATPDLPENPRGLTIGFSINYMAAARGQKLTADARVIRRGGSVCVILVAVTDDKNTQIAHATFTYKLSSGKAD